MAIVALLSQPAPPIDSSQTGVRHRRWVCWRARNDNHSPDRSGADPRQSSWRCPQGSPWTSHTAATTAADQLRSPCPCSPTANRHPQLRTSSILRAVGSGPDRRMGADDPCETRHAGCGSPRPAARGSARPPTAAANSAAARDRLASGAQPAAHSSLPRRVTGEQQTISRTEPASTCRSDDVRLNAVPGTSAKPPSGPVSRGSDEMRARRKPARSGSVPDPLVGQSPACGVPLDAPSPGVSTGGPYGTPTDTDRPEDVGGTRGPGMYRPGFGS